jgi:hypothetical protein
MKKLIYITIFSLVFTSCNSNKKQNIDKNSSDNNSVLVNENNSIDSDNLIKGNSTNKGLNISPIHGELNKENLAKYYPNITDTIKDLRIIGSEKINMKPENGISVSLLHNTGTFDQMIICTHNKKNELIDNLYIGKATDFDNGKSHTIEYLVINDNEIVFNQVDWGFMEKDNEEEIDTVRYERLNIKINKNGRIKYNKTIPNKGYN